MSIASMIAQRGLTEVLHFTTNSGLVGILGSGRVLSREQLPTDKYLEHVYEPNAEVRKDRAWLDYVNLSITRLNWEFFGVSRRWHARRDVWWCALAFDAAVLETPGAVFTTTNNIYTGVRRATDAGGLEALFAPKVTRWSGHVVVRPDGMPGSWTTCHQAEVLIPVSVPASRLRRIVVATDAHADIAAAQCEILHGDVAIDVSPDAFEAQLVH